MTRPLTSLLGSTLGALALTSCASMSDLGSTGTRPTLSSETGSLWADHIVASESELAWEQIPWRPSFLTGLREAAAAEKPLLLWVMNGHPLGCT